ncbi:MAG TPA: TIGR03545 family protein, partial [Candidatus Goldiibacteriota bacterium]|nr:TIGR03545 family protein [Candidatus Goldiibacteriota bacterium]
TVKSLIINAGEGIFKAVVEVKSVDVQIAKSRIEIKGLKIADKDNEFRNLFETEKIVFDYEFVPLLKKKVIIDDVELIGMATGTKREKSGKLPPKKIKKIEKKEQKEKKDNKLFADLNKKISDKAGSEIKKLPVTKTVDKVIDLKDKKIEDFIKKEDMESYKTIISSKIEIEEMKKDIENKINNLNIEKRSEEIKKKADGIKSIRISSAADIPVAQEKLKELETIKGEVNAIKQDINSVKTESERLVKFTVNVPGNVKSAKDKDVQAIMSKMDFNILNAKDIETALIGPAWKSRIDKILSIMSLVDKYVKPGKQNKKKGYYEVVRNKGTDIQFIADKPSFWIKQIKISKSDKTDGLGISGKISNLCFEQNLINKPCIAELSGKKGGKSLNVSIKINRINDVNDVYSIRVAGFSTEDMGLNSADYGNIRFIDGVVDSDINAIFMENQIKIDGNLGISKVRFDASDKQDIVYSVISSIENVKIGFNAVASDSNLKFNVTSDILNKIDSALKKVYGEKVQEAKDEIEKRITDVVKNENEALNKISKQSVSDVKGRIDELSKNAGSLDAYVDNVKNEILKKIKDAQKGSLDG